MSHENRQIHLVSRPRGSATLENFKLHVHAIPELNEGEVLISRSSRAFQRTRFRKTRTSR